MITALFHAWAVWAIAGITMAWWLVSRRLWPFGPCPACRGRAGRNWGSNARRWGVCTRCGGSGRRNR